MIRVLIWENYWGPAALSHCGHAALAIASATGKVQSYISWWPKSSKELFGNRTGGRNNISEDFRDELGEKARESLISGKYEARSGQSNSVSYMSGGLIVPNDEKEWMQSPTQVISLPSIDHENDFHVRYRFGLSESNIKDWWLLYRKKLEIELDHKYAMVSRTNNCAAMVMAALRVGGCEAFLESPKWCAYFSPNDVRDYALELQSVIVKTNLSREHIDDQILANREACSAPRRNRVSEIWSVEEWKSRSSVFLGRRKDQILIIDECIRRYWNAGLEWEPNNYAEKCTALRDMLTQIQDHIIQKPNSDRKTAVLTLGSQCIEVIRQKQNDPRIRSFINNASLTAVLSN